MALQPPARSRLFFLAAVVAACWLSAGARVASASRLTVEYRFTSAADGTIPGGAEPEAGLTSSGGAFYGTTSRGGSYQVNGFGGGVAFKLFKSGTSYKKTVLHAFTGESDGIFPGSGNLLVDRSNHVYGATAGWGLFINEGIPGCGPNQNISCDTVFELSPSGTRWSYAMLHRFAGGADGYDPQGGLIMDNKSGALYGTTVFGGNKGCAAEQPYPMTGCGTVFRLAKVGSKWVKTVLYTFTGGADGALPAAALVLDPSGNGVLYGTASSGGRLSNTGDICMYGAYCGVVFKLTPTTKPPWKETVLHSFTGGVDGAVPVAAMVLKSGVLYGTASAGGNYSGYGCGASGGGAVFTLTVATRQFRTLYDFKCGSDGGVPLGAVTLDTAGNIYGTTSNIGKGYNTYQCGTHIGCGTVFKLTHRASTPWAETHLYDFIGDGNGGQSQAGLLVLPGPTLWGTTRLGGAASCQIDPFTAGCGVVFSIAP